MEEKTVSLWSYINRDEMLHSMTNPIYEYNKNTLWPSISPQSLVSGFSPFVNWFMVILFNKSFGKVTV